MPQPKAIQRRNRSISLKSVVDAGPLSANGDLMNKTDQNLLSISPNKRINKATFKSGPQQPSINKIAGPIESPRL